MRTSSEIVQRGKTAEWTLGQIDCAGFKSRRILSLGYAEAGAGYRILRRNPGFSNINLTVWGRGEMLIQDKWWRVTPGMAVVSPQGLPHAARSIPGVRWEFCWICFAETPGHSACIASRECVVAHTDPRPVAWALQSLQREFRQARQKPVIEALLQLLDLYLRRILMPWPGENHLWKLWDKVAGSPAYAWTDDEMARQVHLSSRHLLRLCKKETDRTLREQLAHIRLSRAASLLQDRTQKLQAVAEAVGYQDGFAFSKAFKRWSGVSPKTYRA